MAFTVTFYRFNKRENSTARPTGGTNFDVTMKDDCSIINPVLKIGYGNTTDFVMYNYCYIPLFDRYYWITNWTFRESLWYAELSIDALASWKDTIGASYEYVLRSSYTCDGKILDSYYPTNADTDSKILPLSIGFANTNYQAGSYVVGIIGANSVNTVGAITYYVLSPEAFADFRALLMSNVDWLNITDIGEELTKALFNPFQYIASVYYYPFIVTSISSPVSVIQYGYWEFAVTGARVLSQSYVYETSQLLSLPIHPDYDTNHQYLRLSPYSRYLLKFRPWGTIPIDPTVCDGVLRIEWEVDLITGVGTLTLYNYNDGVDIAFATYSSQVGVPIQIAQLSTDVLGTVSTAVQAIGDIASSAFSLNNVTGKAGAVMGAVNTAGAVVTGIESTVKSAMPLLQTTGSNGSLIELDTAPCLSVFFLRQVSEDNEHRGRPLCQKVQVSSVPGYLLIADADISITGTQMEQQLIKSYMESGFYYA